MREIVFAPGNIQKTRSPIDQRPDQIAGHFILGVLLVIISYGVEVRPERISGNPFPKRVTTHDFCRKSDFRVTWEKKTVVINIRLGVVTGKNVLFFLRDLERMKYRDRAERAGQGAGC